MSIRREKKAFTLVEIMLVSVLIAVIGLTIYGSFSAGSRIWQRVKDDVPEIDAHIFLGKLSQDLRNCFKSSVVAACGTGNNLSFAVLQESLAAPGVPSVYGKLTYAFDADKGEIRREFQGVDRSKQPDAAGARTVVFNNIKSCLFTYYYLDGETKEGSWRNSMDGSLPSAVRVDLSFVSQNSKVETLLKIISVYAGR